MSCTRFGLDTASTSLGCSTGIQYSGVQSLEGLWLLAVPVCAFGPYRLPSIQEFLLLDALWRVMGSAWAGHGWLMVETSRLVLWL